MAKLSEKIATIRTETRVDGIVPVQVGEVLEELNEKKPSTFKSISDPTLDANNEVKDGDIWIFTGTPLTRYERIGDAWVSLTGSGSSSSGISIFSLDAINGNGDRRVIFNFNGNKNFIIKSKN